MLSRLQIKNFTVFGQAELKFGKNLNVIVGENGAGKTHLLKLAYSILAVSAEEGRKPHAATPTKRILQERLADKLVKVFRPEYLGQLARRQRGRQRCEITLTMMRAKQSMAFNFATQSTTDVGIVKLPEEWVKIVPAYVPTRELLTIFPNFVSVYDGHYLELEETWRDTCVLLGAPLKRGPRETTIKQLLEPLEQAMEGFVDLDRNGRFYLVNNAGRMEMPLVAEGLRKLGMLSRLIATGTLSNKGCLFWDEPEANLNPRLIRGVAQSIVELSHNGIQVFIASHSLFLLRELEIILSQDKYEILDVRFFGLHRSDDGAIGIDQGATVAEIGDIAALDEELSQSDRFLAVGEEA